MILYVFMLLLSFISLLAVPSLELLHDRIESSIIAAAWGDVLGGVTEFDQTPEKIFKHHPQGVLSIDDFTFADWAKFPAKFQRPQIAPYTDDTAMALVVADYLLKVIGQQSKTVFDDLWMEGLAEAFIEDSNQSFGWKAPFRAPGVSTMNALSLLAHEKDTTQWPLLYKNFQKNGGCGSVMRAYPCGLAFYNQLINAEKSAVAQSKITHGDSIALAASAAFAVGVAQLLQSKEGSVVDDVIDDMVKAAMAYDYVTGQKIKEGYRAGLVMRDLLSRNSLLDLLSRYSYVAAQELVNQLQLFDKENNEIARHHFAFCQKFPGWDAATAIAAAVYAATASVDNPYLGIVLGIHSTGDSDSVASIAGALLGACYGKKALPQSVWEKEIPRIENRDLMYQYIENLYALHRGSASIKESKKVASHAAFIRNRKFVNK